MSSGNNMIPAMSMYGRDLDHHHHHNSYNQLPPSVNPNNSNMLSGYPIMYPNHQHNHPAGDLLTLQMQLQSNASNNENDSTLAALQRNWIALQQNHHGHSSMHHPSPMGLQGDEMSYMRNLLPINGSNSSPSPLHSNQPSLMDTLKLGSTIGSQSLPHHHGNSMQPSILDNGNGNISTSPSGRLQISMNSSNNVLGIGMGNMNNLSGVNVDIVPGSGMICMNNNNPTNVGNSINNNMEWQGGIPIRNIPDLMTMLDLSDIPPHVQIPKYYEGIKISLGEAGREILRCYINQRGIRGKFMSSSNLQQLLRVAHQCGLWNAAVRLHLEFIGEIPMTASHAEMRKYKSLQTKRRLSKRISVLSKFGAPVVRRADGEETIEYRDGMKLSLGVDGRKLLLKRIREARSSRESEINSLFSKYGLKYSQLRNATIHELCRMAYVCGLWEEAVKLHFQHIRKKAHETSSNHVESGSDDDSDLDMNKDRDDVIPNSFLQQIHSPNIDLLNSGNSNIATSGLHSSIHGHPPMHSHPSHLQHPHNVPVHNISNHHNHTIHPSLSRPLPISTSDHLNFDDYRNYILDTDGSSSNGNSINTSNINSGNNLNISINEIKNSLKSVNPNDNNNKNNSMINIRTTGALGTGIGSNSIDNIYDPINSSHSDFDDYSLLSASLRKRSGDLKTDTMENKNGITTASNINIYSNNRSDNRDNNIKSNSKDIHIHTSSGQSSPIDNINNSSLSVTFGATSHPNNLSDSNSNINHPNTSSFLMDTLTGILGDEVISSNMNDKILHINSDNNSCIPSSNLSSTIKSNSDGLNIVSNNISKNMPQLSAVAVVAAAKAATAQAVSKYSIQCNDNNRHEPFGVLGHLSTTHESTDIPNSSLFLISSHTHSNSYSSSSTSASPIDQDININMNHRRDDAINTTNNKSDNSKVNNKIYYQSESLHHLHNIDSTKNNDVPNISNNMDSGPIIVSRGLTSQSTTDTSIESGN
ncbi:hypothetical protein cand_010520 [Cryptosporidium andersoni]|uniref:Uncharacterized protein n=1 Tax=Cryptosporidium andersoni TaxID=117008 RepID=A0A1J4MQ30_9CRYT|nr:hypothetical protein cand_010520 [Cryptosporidium andersoni]